MSVCKKHLLDPAIQQQVLKLYAETVSTVEQTAKKVGITPHTTYRILRNNLSAEQFRGLKALKYGFSKTAERSPHFGKRGAEMPNFRGDCPDGYGYLTRLVNGHRYFVHQIVMAEAMGIPVENFPENMVIHHIDTDRSNNCLHNLAITTISGHTMIHKRYRLSPEELELRGLSVAEAIQYLTSHGGWKNGPRKRKEKERPSEQLELELSP